jgi:hypothetical protein
LDFKIDIKFTYRQTPFAPGPKYNELILHRIILLATSIVGYGGGWIMVWWA